jgi:hypothetical protein
LSFTASLVLAVVYLISAFHFFRHPSRPPDFFNLLFVLAWLLLATVEWWRQWHQRDFDPDYGKEQCFEFSEDAILRGTDPTTTVRLPWTKISRYVETDDFFILSSPWPWGIEKPEKPSVFRKQKMPVLYILPKRAFASGDVERFRNLLQSELSVWAKNPGLKADAILTA